MTSRGRIAVGSVSACLAVFLGLGTADANTSYFFSGQACQGDTGSSSNVDYTSNGAGNTSTSTSQHVWCPVGGNNSVSVNLEALGVWTYDARSDAELSCAMYIRDSSGTYYISATKGSSVSLTGYRVISWSGTELPNSGSLINPVNTYAYYCTIPANSGGESFLRSYYVEQVSP